MKRGRANTHVLARPAPRLWPVYAKGVGGEDEGRAAGNAGLRDAARAVAELGGDGQEHAVAHALAHQALIPTGDDHADADLEGQGAAAVEGVVEVGRRAEDRAVVVAGDRVAGLDLLAVAGAQDLDDELVRGGAVEGEGGLTAKFAGDRNVLHGFFLVGVRVG